MRAYLINLKRKRIARQKEVYKLEDQQELDELDEFHEFLNSGKI
jgi:hypothetical protein